LSFYCEVCNGMTTLTASCPRCRRQAVDYGRYNDFLGPYAPYRAIDDISLTNGFLDVSRHECVHMLSCSACNYTFPLSVNERSPLQR